MIFWNRSQYLCHSYKLFKSIWKEHVVKWNLKNVLCKSELFTWISLTVQVNRFSYSPYRIWLNRMWFCVMICSFCLWHWWIFYHLYYVAISILNGALCNQSQQLEAIIIVTKSSILYVTGVLDPPLKSIDELR